MVEEFTPSQASCVRHGGRISPANLLSGRVSVQWWKNFPPSDGCAQRFSIPWGNFEGHSASMVEEFPPEARKVIIIVEGNTPCGRYG
jgi:hypothetical protein